MALGLVVSVVGWSSLLLAKTAGTACFIGDDSRTRHNDHKQIFHMSGCSTCRLLAIDDLTRVDGVDPARLVDDDQYAASIAAQLRLAGERPTLGWHTCFSTATLHQCNATCKRIISVAKPSRYVRECRCCRHSLCNKSPATTSLQSGSIAVMTVMILSTTMAFSFS